MVNRSFNMFPGLHDEVAALVKPYDINLTFHTQDTDARCIETYDTNITGDFTCTNKKCSSPGWSSKIVPITIRMYDGNKYNARVYNQRCRACNWSYKPKLNSSYAERVAYRLKKWHGVPVERVPYGGKKDDKPHMSQYCMGCAVGRCRNGDDDFSWLDL